MTSKSKPNMLLFLLLACLWSGSFIGIKVVVGVWPPLFGAAVRVGIALLCLFIFIKATQKNTQVPHYLRWKIWVMGIFSQGIPFACLFVGEQSIPPGLAGIINGTVSLWTFILSLIFLRQTTTFSIVKLAGLLLGLFGVIVIFAPLLSFDKTDATLFGASAVLSMAFSYAIGNVLNQYFLTGKAKIDFFTNVFHQHIASFCFLVVISLMFGEWPNASTLIASSKPWLASLYLGLFSTAIAWVIYYHLIREWDGVRASSVMYIVPVLALVWDYLIYNNAPIWSEMIGVVVILSGVILIQFSTLRSAFIARIKVSPIGKVQ